MEKNKKLIIIGNGETALLAYEYFTNDSCYEVVAFSVDIEYINEKTINNLPVVAFDDLLSYYPPNTVEAFCAVSSTRLNVVREDLYIRTKKLGYKLATYISSKAYIPSPHKTIIGDNCFIMEYAIIQPFVKIGNDVTIWGNTHIGHSSVIGDHCFFAGHIVVSGYVNFGQSCFVGGNASFSNNINIGDHCMIGMASVILKDVEPYSIYKAKHASKQIINTKQFYNL